MRAGSQQNVWKVLRGHQQQETHRLKMTFVRPHEVSAVLTDPLMVVLREVHLHTHTHTSLFPQSFSTSVLLSPISLSLMDTLSNFVLFWLLTFDTFFKKKSHLFLVLNNPITLLVFLCCLFVPLFVVSYFVTFIPVCPFSFTLRNFVFYFRPSLKSLFRLSILFLFLFCHRVFQPIGLQSLLFILNTRKSHGIESIKQTSGPWASSRPSAWTTVISWWQPLVSHLLRHRSEETRRVPGHHLPVQSQTGQVVVHVDKVFLQSFLHLQTHTPARTPTRTTTTNKQTNETAKQLCTPVRELQPLPRPLCTCI